LSAAADGRIPARRALALGIVQGPAELLPVSSSAHIVLLPWLAGWDWDGLDAEVRKSFEVALHGVAASFASTLASQRLINLVERDRALWPYAAYRAALAAAVLAKLRAR
jgi:undecaprenyl pyrophosphate phosphatase UppP